MTTKLDRSSETGSVALDEGDFLRRFTLLALASLDLPPTREADEVYVIHASEDQPPLFNGTRTARFVFAQQDPPPAQEAEVVSRGSRAFHWLCERLEQSDRVIQAVPREQVTHIRDFATALFEAYDVEDGNVQLAGCQLQDRPMLQFVFEDDLDDQANRPPSSRGLHVIHVDEDGELIDDVLASRLGLMDVVVPNGKIKRLSDQRVREWRQRGNSLAASQQLHRSLIAIVVVWCKYATGKLAFTVEAHRVEQPFQGWAQLFAHKSMLPPPYKCPASGIESYHLALADDGVLTCREAIAVCSVSKKRVLANTLETCAVSGERATVDNMVACPLSDERVLRTVAQPCDMCQQLVSPSVLVRGRCELCRHLRPIDKDDPLMARVLGEWPRLDSWRSWSVSESKAIYVFVATGLLKRLLIVATKDPLEVQRLASSTRFSKHWTDVDPTTRDQSLG